MKRELTEPEALRALRFALCAKEKYAKWLSSDFKIWRPASLDSQIDYENHEFIILLLIWETESYNALELSHGVKQMTREGDRLFDIADELEQNTDPDDIIAQNLFESHAAG